MFIKEGSLRYAMEIISDFNHYIIEFIISAVLGFFFANRIEKFIIIVAIMVIASVSLAMVYDETVNPNKYNLMNSTGVSNISKNITDITILGLNIILALAFGGDGTGFGTGVRVVINRIFQR